jgi:Uma2 family endonuclease
MADDVSLSVRPALFTADEFEKACRSGVFGDRRLELVGGVIVEMNAVHVPHARTRRILAQLFDQALSQSGLALEIDDEVSIKFAVDYPTPDIVIHTQMSEDRALRGHEVRMIIEVSGATLSEDLGPKRARYAANAVPEYWVVDIQNHIIRRFHGEDLNEAAPVKFGGLAESLTIPGLFVKTEALPKL